MYFLFNFALYNNKSNVVFTSSIEFDWHFIFLGITAGVFEECGRYMGFKLTLKKHRRFGDGVAFALGHGGIEALLIAGISSLYNLIILLNLNLGNDNGTILGMDANEAMIAFNSVNNISVLTIGLERIPT